MSAQVPPLATALVIAEPVDYGAKAVAGAVASREPWLQVLTLTPAQMARSGWRHQVSGAGAVQTTLRLCNRRLVDTEVAVVWCRVHALSPPAFLRATPKDRDYASAEFLALATSWLRSLGARVVNDVQGSGLVGPVWPQARWLWEAHRAGLPISTHTVATSVRLETSSIGSPGATGDPRQPAVAAAAGRALVAGTRVVGEIPAAHVAGCLRLAAAAKCRCLGVNFCFTSGGVAVTSVDPVPAIGRDDEADACAAMLAQLAHQQSSDTGR